MKRGLEAYTSSQVIAIRALSGFIVLSPLIKKYITKHVLAHWKPIFFMGLFGILLPGYLFVESLKGINSATGSIVNAMVPVFTLVFAVLLFREKTKLINVMGVLLGFVGTASLIMINKTGPIGGSNYYLFLALLASGCNAATVLIIRYYLGSVNSIAVAVVALCITGTIAGCYLFTTDFLHVLLHTPKGITSCAYVFVLGALGTALAIILFNALIKITDAVFAASVTYVVPVVAIVLGVLDGEVLLFEHFTAMLVILVGVYLVNYKSVITP